MQVAHPSFFWKHCWPAPLQHIVEAQLPPPSPVQSVATQFASGPCGGGIPGVVGPSCVQSQGLESMSYKLGPGSQPALHPAHFSFFLKHAMPGWLQHKLSKQLPPAPVHLSTVQGPAFCEFVKEGSGAPGVGPPNASQSQGSDEMSVISKPGVHFGLQLAHFSFFVKQVIPESLQQPVSWQFSPISEHLLGTHAAGFSPPQ
mmetsp:Transcript_91600/g.222538  ORF Transcript_91600/g.222538 Transcript_91600/m.222538 type:complete len:201 (+) Transcript_91600:1063-1665(+)